MFNRLLNRIIRATLGKHVAMLKARFIDPLISNSDRDDFILSSSSSKKSSVSLPKEIEIPVVYGRCRMQCHVIWADKVVSIRDEEDSSGSSYVYVKSFAVGICRGPIFNIGHILVNGQNIGIQKNIRIRVYYGTEDQTVDPLIAMRLQHLSTPYKGLAYIVIQNFPASDYSPSIKVEAEISGIYDAEYRRRYAMDAINLIGNGEFTYDTLSNTRYLECPEGAGTCQRRDYFQINEYHTAGSADVIVSLHELKRAMPGIRWVCVTVYWFATTYDIKDADIRPGVEFRGDHTATNPVTWVVSKYTRDTAELIKKDANGKLIYTGTAGTICVDRIVSTLKQRGYKVMLKPILLVNREDKPWSGKMVCNASDVSNFFNKEEGYNNFITHYARVHSGLLDAFLIGSELVSLTSCRDNDGNFVAIKELKKLADIVRVLIPGNVMVSYAAHWLEYHHTDGGWYNLDPLWSDPNIHFIGINNYMPLTEDTTSSYDIEYLIKCFDSGEGYDYFYEYTDSGKKKRPLAEKYAWKNIEWWWSNLHYNPDGAVTSWIPESKKIWFTEYGFPSVHLATNKPSAFLPSDETSSLPIHSNGKLDFRMQKVAICAMEKRWQDSKCVQRKFLQSWDARPYPTWPERLDAWNDTEMWEKGHDVQGKFDTCYLAIIIEDLCERAQIPKDKVVTSELIDKTDGFFILQNSTCEEIIQQLKEIFLFDIVEDDGKIHFISRKNGKKVPIPVEHILRGGGSFKASKICEFNEIQRYAISFINTTFTYDKDIMQYNSESKTRSLSLLYEANLVINRVCGKHLLKKIVENSFAYLRQYEICMGLSLHIMPSDILIVKIGGGEVSLRVIMAVRYEHHLYLFCYEENIVKNLPFDEE
ncbi:baseplate megatron protein TIM-barrel domain-containing protein [Candidatus Fokinia solitaria]|nr:glycoside hydrolase TIM-barrel-like domain-containing protein [Candidatus Fokinia solitaria]